MFILLYVVKTFF